MASKVNIKTHGNTTLEGIELENFSTEETLAALLEQFKAFSAGFTTDRTDTKQKTEKSQTKLEKLVAGLAGAGVGVSKISEVVTKMIGPALNMFNPLVVLFEDLAELTPEVLLAVVAFKLVSAALGVFQGALNLVSRGITSLFSVSGNLFGTFLSGKTAMSDYIAAIQRGTASIPIIGTFFSLLSSGSAMLEGWNQTLIESTKMGGNFNGNITDLVNGAADAGLSVEQFSNVIKENAEQLATFGTVMNGVNTYTKVSKISMQEYSNQLSELGISFAQYSQELPRILGLFGASMKAHGASDRELAQSAINLTAQFDAMTQISGKTREQQANDLGQLTQDAAWQRSMTKMTKQEQEGYLSALNELSNTSGKAYAELYKLSVIGMPPLTKELQILLATTPGLNSEFQRMTQAVKSGIKGAELGAKMDDIASDMVANGLKVGENLQTLIAASTAGLGSGDAIANAQKDLLAHSKEFFDADGNFQEDRYRAQLARDRKRAEAEDGVSQKLIVFSNMLSVFREDFYVKVIGPLVEKLAGPIQRIVEGVSKSGPAFTSIVDKIVGLVTDFGNWINNPQTDLKGDIESFIDTVQKIISMTISVVKFIWIIVKFVADNWGWLKNVITAIILALGTKGLLMALDGVIGLLGKFGYGIGNAIGTLARFAGFGGGTVAEVAGGGAAVAGEGAQMLLPFGAAAGEGAEVAGLATLAGGAGLAGIIGTEAAVPIIGLGLAGLTALGVGGYMLYQHYKKKNAEQNAPENVEKQSYTQSADADTSVDNLQNISDRLAIHERILNRIADNTGMGARYGKNTRDALGA